MLEGGTADHGALAEVWTTVQAGGGWSSLGLSLFSAQSAIMFLIDGKYTGWCH
jgi:hypothetical protein